jgi:cytochrome P450
MSTSVSVPPRRTAPGPRGRLLTGVLPDFRADPIHWMLETRRTHGDVARFRLGPMPCYLVAGPEGVQRVLVDNARTYGKGGPSYSLMRSMLGQGLLTAEGDHWLRQRRLSAPAFHRQRLAGLASMMSDAAARTRDGWQRTAAGSGMLDVNSAMMHLTLEIVCRALFSAEVDDEADAISRALDDAMEHVIYRARNLVSAPGWVPTPGNRRFQRASQDFDRVVYGIIARRREAGGDTGDLLSMLMLTSDADTGETMNERQLRDEMITLLLAGFPGPFSCSPATRTRARR